MGRIAFRVLPGAISGVWVHAAAGRTLASVRACLSSVTDFELLTHAVAMAFASCLRFKQVHGFGKIGKFEKNLPFGTSGNRHILSGNHVSCIGCARGDSY